MTTWEYIRDLFKPTDRIAICWKIHTEHYFNQRIVTAEAACTDRYQRFLRAMNAQGNNVYISMNPIRADSMQHRQKTDIAEIRRIYLDVDHDGDNVLNTILTDSSLPKPNYVLNTSPAKYQIIWNVTGFSPDQAEALMRSLCRQFHSDRATVDIARVFRLPGLHNKKYDATFRVTARKLTTTVYTAASFPAPDSTTTATGITRQRSLSTTPRNTQSERDWAYCCRALWPDPNNETVVAKLLAEMERRAQGRRAKPRYYAELTVSKARKYIAAKRGFSK